MTQRSLRCVAFAAFALILISAPLASAQPIAIDIQVVDEPGDGFNDPCSDRSD